MSIDTGTDDRVVLGVVGHALDPAGRTRPNVSGDLPTVLQAAPMFRRAVAGYDRFQVESYVQWAEDELAAADRERVFDRFYRVAGSEAADAFESDYPGSEDDPLEVQDVSLALSVPAHAGELLDFAGRWATERIPQRIPITAGVHSRPLRKNAVLTPPRGPSMAGKP